MSKELQRTARLLLAGLLLAGGVLVAVTIVGPQPAGAATPDVLATTSSSGPSVSVGDVLTQNVELTGPDIGCTSGSAEESVSADPASPGVADLSMSDLAFSGCTATSGNFPMTLTADGLPYSPMTISESDGNQVSIGGTVFTAVINAGVLGTYTCSLTSSGMNGSWSNSANTMTFSNQGFTASGDSLCSNVAVSITLGPVVDSSASGSPIVYVTDPPFTPSSPTISNLPASAYYGGGFTPVVSTTGDGATSVTSSTPSACTTSGLAVTYVGVGTCTLTAQVTAGTDYSAAEGTAQSFTVLGFSVLTSSLPGAAPGTPYAPVTLRVAGAGISDSPYATTLKWKALELPKGLKVSPAGALSGTPNAKLQPGSLVVVVQVTGKWTIVNGYTKTKTTTEIQASIPLTIN
jgi:hypothetical protein